MKALLRPKSGDLFYIPAADVSGTHGFVVARYIELIEPNVGHLIEVFARFYTSPPLSINDVDRSCRLFRPVMFDMYFRSIPRWKILFSDPSYDKRDSNYQNIAIGFEFGNSIWIGGNSWKADEHSLRGVEPSICWRTDHLIFRVNAHLANVLGPDECFDYHRLPLAYRVDNVEAIESVIALAKELDQRFQALHTTKRSTKKRRLAGT